MAKQSLLDRAKAEVKHESRRRVYDKNDETLALAVAYLNGEVNSGQVARVGVCRREAVQFWAAAILRWGIEFGKVQRLGIKKCRSA